MKTKKINVLIRVDQDNLDAVVIATASNKVALRGYLKNTLKVEGNWADNKLDFLTLKGDFEYLIQSSPLL
jgi:hypothetical protein